MSEGAAEGGGAPISGDQFGDVTGSTDVPPYDSAQNPGDGIPMYGFYPPNLAFSPRPRARRRKRKRNT